MPLKILFAGSGAFGLPTLEALRQAGYEIVQIYTQPDRPAGRGKTLTPTPVAEFAIKENLPTIRTDQLNSQPLPEADVLVVIAFGQKISPAVANHCRLGSVNLHASLLPKYRGAAPINWAIVRGETEAGNSIIRLADRMDAGAVLGQSHLQIGETETAGELHDRLAIDGAGLMVRVLEDLAQGRAVELPQDESQATTAPKLSRETAKIDWNHTAQQIARLIRGLSPWPGCRVRLMDADGKETARLTLLRAKASEISNLKPGQICLNGMIATTDGAVEILELQPEGKRPMALVDFQNGKPWRQGMSLETI
jgi:methionyl-tRNA formyltransferase